MPRPPSPTHSLSLISSCPSLAKPHRGSRGSPAGVLSLSRPRASDQAWRQEQGKKISQTWSQRSRCSASVQTVFSSMTTRALPWPAPALLRLLFVPPASSWHHPWDACFQRLQGPCKPDLGAEMSDSEVEELLSFTGLSHSSTEEPRARGLWDKASIHLFTQAHPGLAVCGRHLCIHW